MTTHVLTSVAPPRTRRKMPGPIAEPSVGTPLATPQRHTPHPHRTRPAALRWQDAWLPGVGRVRAGGWLPTVLIAACAVALVYLVQTSGVATTGYDIQRLQAERSEWQLRNEQLRLELAKLRSLAWVESEAIGRLGMQRPESVSYLTVGNPQPSR